MTNNKYIAVAQRETSIPIIIMFPGQITHFEMAKAMEGLRLPHVISAGCVDEFLQCYGESYTLRIKSRPEDTDILHRQLDINDKKINLEI